MAQRAAPREPRERCEPCPPAVEKGAHALACRWTCMWVGGAHMCMCLACCVREPRAERREPRAEQRQGERNTVCVCACACAHVRAAEQGSGTGGNESGARARRARCVWLRMAWLNARGACVVSRVCEFGTGLDF